MGLQVFKNDLFEVALKLDNGDVVFDVEYVAKSLGIIQKKNSIEYVRWERVNEYLKPFGKTAEDFSPQVGKGDFISESAVYKLAFKASNEVAEKFQDWLAVDVLPTIRKTGGYVNNDDLFVNTYLKFADDGTKLMFKQTLETVRKQNELIIEQQKSIEHKEGVIIALVDKVTLAEKRQILNRVVRYKGANFQERWRELYRQFEMKYHIDLTRRLETYNINNKPKMKSKIDYIDKVMDKVSELYEIACKLYENDVKELARNLYDIA